MSQHHIRYELIINPALWRQDKEGRSVAYKKLKQAMAQDIATLQQRHPSMIIRIDIDDAKEKISIRHPYPEFTEMFMGGATDKLGWLSFWEIPTKGEQEKSPMVLVERVPEDIIDESNRILAMAEARVQKQLILPKKAQDSDWISSSQGLPEDFLGDIIAVRRALGAQLRLVIGEQATQQSARLLLLHSMPVLAAQGITLGLGLFLKEQQSLVDRWLTRDEADAPIPPALDFYIRFIDRNFETKRGVGYREILLAAKKHRVPMVFMGSEAALATLHKPSISYQQRVMIYNEAATQLLEQSYGMAGFLALVHICHAGDYLGFGQNNRFPAPVKGIASLTGGVSIGISDLQEQMANPRLGLDVQDYLGHSLSLDALLVNDHVSMERRILERNRKQFKTMSSMHNFSLPDKESDTQETSRN
ncbi:MAG: hypothetical protein ACOYK8_06005 [Alphaproteobacteria bacterium]